MRIRRNLKVIYGTEILSHGTRFVEVTVVCGATAVSQIPGYYLIVLASE